MAKTTKKRMNEKENETTKQLLITESLTVLEAREALMRLNFQVCANFGIEQDIKSLLEQLEHMEDSLDNQIDKI